MKLWIAALVAAVVVCFLAWPREPVYEGRTLSEWLRKLSAAQMWFDDPPARAESFAQWELELKRDTQAIQAIGPRSLPWLLRWLRAEPRPSAVRIKVQAVLDRLPFVDSEMFEAQDRSMLAVLGFGALGEAAGPALPELGRMLLSAPQSERAVMCLTAIGAKSFPFITPALTHTNMEVRRAGLDCLSDLGNQIGAPAVPLLIQSSTNDSPPRLRQQGLLALGNIGPAAQDCEPWLQTVIRDETHPLAGVAMRVITQVSKRPEEYLECFTGRLARTNWAADAAFALSQLGSAGVSPLMKALAQDREANRNAGYAALGPEVFLEARPPKRSFIERSYAFDGEVRAWEMSLRLRRTNLVQMSFASRVAEHLGSADSAVRLEMVELLRYWGRFATVGLSRALLDPQEEVRKAAARALDSIGIEVQNGAIIRGQKDKRQIALVFTGHEYAEGLEMILDQLEQHHAQGSFFFTGDFLSNPNFAPSVDRVFKDGHYLGPHSDKHLLYCSWEAPNRTLITRDEFNADFSANVHKLAHTIPVPRYFIPPYEHCNLEIVKWAAQLGYLVVNLTPGTRSAADYTGEADTDFVSSRSIFGSILARERDDPNGLNGFMLLFHVGAGPGRADKFHRRFGELLDALAGKGYSFVAVDELFEPGAAELRRQEARSSEGFRKRYGLGR